ncbi:hypothetical protein [Marinomonas epiphytica]
MLVYLLISLRARYRVGIDESGAYLLYKGQRNRLEFVRVNGFQLIARVYDKNDSVRLWNPYIAIYRDGLDRVSYQILRSFGAQQILMRQQNKEK